MRRLFAAAALGAVALVGSACGTDSEPSADPETVAACAEYNRLINERSTMYGNEMGAVGQAAAAGDEDRKDTAVAVVRDLFVATADGLRDQAGEVTDEELSSALTEAADGLVEVSEQIDDYEDVAAADQLMADSAFADAGARVSEICARG